MISFHAYLVPANANVALNVELIELLKERALVWIWPEAASATTSYNSANIS
jgi:hypothetical protein